MMPRLLRGFIVAALLVGAVSGASAVPFDLTGTWALQSMTFIDVATGIATKDFGEHPKGYVIYAPGGYMSVVINAEGRQPVTIASADAAEQRAKLLMTMTSHAGPYRFADGKLVNHVEVAHDPGMVGTDLVRFIRVIDSRHLESTTPVTERPDGKKLKTVLIWQKVQ
jgi:Lipocalin-like domain